MQLHGSVKSRSAHLSPGICHFVLKSWKCPTVGPGVKIKNPTMGLKNRVQMYHPGTSGTSGTTPKLHFPVDKLQIPDLWEICNNLVNFVREASYTNQSKPLVIIIAKNVTLI